MTFWLFGDGYKEEKYDRLCFDDIKIKEKCIEKDAVFSVSNSKNRGTILTVYDGSYHLKNNGEIINLKRGQNHSSRVETAIKPSFLEIIVIKNLLHI